jgi:hypothetical protein
MLTQDELHRIRTQGTAESIAPLVAEIERLQKFVVDYGDSVTLKLDSLEENRGLLEAENQRLLTAKQMMRLERDACVALLSRIALVQGLSVGAAPAHTAVVELPNGQVSWQIAESESHLLSGLPPYTNPVEELSIEELYSRVMNPGIGAS